MLSNTNTYQGGTMVLGGTLDILSADALPGGTTLTLSSTASVVFASDLGHAIQLELLLIDPPGMGGGDALLHFRGCRDGRARRGRARAGNCDALGRWRSGRPGSVAEEENGDLASIPLN